MIIVGIIKIEINMLFYKKEETEPCWIYYVEKINAEGNEEYVFMKNNERPYVFNVIEKESFFLKLEDHKTIYEVLELEDGKFMLDKYNLEINWSVYLYQDSLIAMSAKTAELSLEKINSYY